MMTPNLTITNKIITQLFLIFLLLVVNTHQQRVINDVIFHEERTVFRNLIEELILLLIIHRQLHFLFKEIQFFLRHSWIPKYRIFKIRIIRFPLIKGPLQVESFVYFFVCIEHIAHYHKINDLFFHFLVVLYPDLVHTVKLYYQRIIVLLDMLVITSKNLAKELELVPVNSLQSESSISSVIKE
jgi:hypothetical protein